MRECLTGDDKATTVTYMTHTAARLLAATPTSSLIQSLLVLDAIDKSTADQTLARVWIIEELERRYPQVDAAMNAWADEDYDCGATYVEALLAAMPVEAFA